MLLSLQAAAADMTALANSQERTANHLANATTVGYKADRSFVQPLEAPSDASGPAVAYFGDDSERNRRVGLETALDINVTGTELHRTGARFTITEAMQCMIDALRENDRDDIEAAQGDIKVAHEYVQRLTSNMVRRQNRLNLVRSQFEEAQMMLENRASEFGDVDVADAPMRFQQ